MPPAAADLQHAQLELNPSVPASDLVSASRSSRSPALVACRTESPCHLCEPARAERAGIASPRGAVDPLGASSGDVGFPAEDCRGLERDGVQRPSVELAGMPRRCGRSCCGRREASGQRSSTRAPPRTCDIVWGLLLAPAGAASRRLRGGRPGFALEPFLQLSLVLGHLLARLAAGERREDRPEQAVSLEVELDR